MNERNHKKPKNLRAFNVLVFLLVSTSNVSFPKEEALSIPRGEIYYYKIQKNETLMLISFRLYGKISYWRYLAKLNKIAVDASNNYVHLRSGNLLKYQRQKEIIRNQEDRGLPYLIRVSDTLKKISHNVYNTTKRWKEIFDNNRDLIEDPSIIFAGFTIFYKPDTLAISEQRGGAKPQVVISEQVMINEKEERPSSDEKEIKETLQVPQAPQIPQPEPNRLYAFQVSLLTGFTKILMADARTGGRGIFLSGLNRGILGQVDFREREKLNLSLWGRFLQTSISPNDNKAFDNRHLNQFHFGLSTEYQTLFQHLELMGTLGYGTEGFIVVNGPNTKFDKDYLWHGKFGPQYAIMSWQNLKVKIGGGLTLLQSSQMIDYQVDSSIGPYAFLNFGFHPFWGGRFKGQFLYEKMQRKSERYTEDFSDLKIHVGQEWSFPTL